MFFLLRVFSLLPARLLQALGWLLGWLTFLTSPTYRRRFVENAQQAGYAFSEVRAAVGHAGKMAAELPKVWAGPPVAVELAAAERALLDALRQSGRGVLFVTPHMGCFELSSQAVAMYWKLDQDASERGPLTVLYRPARKAFLAELLKTVRNRNGQVAVPTDMSGVRAMLKSLRAGGAVGLLPDQVPPWGMGEWTAVFGKPAYTMTIAARLIAQTQPQVVIARCERKPGGRYQLFLAPVPLDEKSTQGELVQQINRAVEQQIRACPQQYMWGYARYKSPRGMPAEVSRPERIEDLLPQAPVNEAG